MKKYDIVDYYGYSAFVCADDGGSFEGFDTLEDAQEVLSRMIEIDSKEVEENGFHIEAVIGKLHTSDFKMIAFVGLLLFGETIGELLAMIF